MSIHYIPGPILDAGDRAGNKTEIPDFMELTFKLKIKMADLFFQMTKSQQNMMNT